MHQRQCGTNKHTKKQLDYLRCIYLFKLCTTHSLEIIIIYTREKCMHERIEIMFKTLSFMPQEAVG